MDGDPAPSWWGIVMLSAAGFAIEFAYAVEAGYGIPAMLKTGLGERYASGMWAVGPVLGILFQGYLGSASDRCRCVWGRRRPFILGIAFGVFLGLGLFPYGRFISEHLLGFAGVRQQVFVAVFTAAAFVVMDFCLDALQSPVRAYLLDSVSIERSEKANYIYSSMVGFGATVGSLVSAIPWEKGHSGDSNSQVEVIFGIALVVMVISILLTLNSVKERVHVETITERGSKHGHPLTNEDDIQSMLQRESEDNETVVGLLEAKDPTVKPSCSLSLQCACSCLIDLYDSISRTFIFVKYMSSQFLCLWLSVFLSWFALLSMYLFLTNFVGEVVYDGLPTSQDEMLRARYDRGVRIGCLCLTLFNIVAFIYSLISEQFSGSIGLRRLLLGGHFFYLVASGITMLFPSVSTSLLISIAGGIYFTNLMSIPYALIPHYMVC